MACRPTRVFPDHVLWFLRKENEGASWVLPWIFWHLEIHREPGSRVVSVMLFVAQAEYSTWFCENSFPTKTTAAIELLNVTKQVPKSLITAFVQPLSSLSTQANIYALTQQRVINTTSTISQCKDPHVDPRAPSRDSLGAHGMNNSANSCHRSETATHWAVLPFIARWPWKDLTGEGTCSVQAGSISKHTWQSRCPYLTISLPSLWFWVALLEADGMSEPAQHSLLLPQSPHWLPQWSHFSWTLIQSR